MTARPSKKPATTPKPSTPTKKAEPIEPTAPAKVTPAKQSKLTVERVDLSARTDAAIALGFSRRWFTDEAGLTGTTALWRTERMGTEEAAKLAAVLDRIEAGKIEPPVRTAGVRASGPTKAELTHKLTSITQLVAQAREAKTLAAARAVLAEVDKLA